MEIKPGTCIYLFDDVISEDFMKDLKVIIDKTEGRKEVYGKGSNVLGKIVLKDHFKNKQFHKIIDDKVYQLIDGIISKLKDINPPIRIRTDSGFQYRKIEGATRLHIDDVFSNPFSEYEENTLINIHEIRIMSVVIALNSDYEGGEIVFPNQNVKIKLKGGQAILFPPYWTHPHYTNELHNSTVRYTINTWLCE